MNIQVTYEVLQTAEIVKWVIIGIGVIGLLIIIIGAFRREKDLTVKGLAILFISVVFGICGQLIFKKSKNKAYQIEAEEYYKSIKKEKEPEYNEFEY